MVLEKCRIYTMGLSPQHMRTGMRTHTQNCVLIFICRGFRVFYCDVLEELAFIRVKGYLEPGK
jgi:hypothetical protein